MAHNSGMGTGSPKTRKYTGTLENYDAVAAVAGSDGAVSRGSDGDLLVGQAFSVEGSTTGFTGVLLVRSNEQVVFKRNGAIPNGMQALVVDGNGAVKAGAAGFGSEVLRTFTEDGVDYVEVAL